MPSEVDIVRNIEITWAFSAATYLLVLGIGYVVHWWMW